MKVFAVAIGIFVVLASSDSCVLASNKKSSVHRAVLKTKTIVQPEKQPILASQASKTKHAKQSKRPTALASKFKALSAVDSRQAADDPTWAPIDSGDLNHLTE